MMTKDTSKHTGLNQAVSAALFFLAVAAIVMAPAGYTVHMLT
ncbi:MAG: hypothetical protein RH946_09590 [Rhodospirillales bacterium]|tara:strand:- start:1813 stop:1938 length:126 start_codon:yes stop_codon:yes gene_type:complete